MLGSESFGDSVAIFVRGIHKSHRGVRFLSGANLNVRDSEFCVLLGSDTRGKTMLLACLAGLAQPDSGTIEINGHELGSWDGRPEVGVVLTTSLLDHNLTVAKNMAFHARVRRLTKEQRADLDVIYDQLDLHEHMNTKVRNLTRGQRRRAEFARALIHNPMVLLLDDPTSGLDSHSATVMWKVIIDQRNRGRTILLATDHSSLASRAHTVAIVETGRIVAHGRTTSLMENFLKGTQYNPGTLDDVLRLVRERAMIEDAEGDLGSGSGYADPDFETDGYFDAEDSLVELWTEDRELEEDDSVGVDIMRPVDQDMLDPSLADMDVHEDEYEDDFEDDLQDLDLEAFNDVEVLDEFIGDGFEHHEEKDAKEDDEFAEDEDVAEDTHDLEVTKEVQPPGDTSEKPASENGRTLPAYVDVVSVLEAEKAAVLKVLDAIKDDDDEDDLIGLLLHGDTEKAKKPKPTSMDMDTATPLSEPRPVQQSSPTNTTIGSLWWNPVPSSIPAVIAQHPKPDERLKPLTNPADFFPPSQPGTQSASPESPKPVSTEVPKPQVTQLPESAPKTEPEFWKPRAMPPIQAPTMPARTPLVPPDAEFGMPEVPLPAVIFPDVGEDLSFIRQTLFGELDNDEDEPDVQLSQGMQRPPREVIAEVPSEELDLDQGLGEVDMALSERYLERTRQDLARARRDFDHDPEPKLPPQQAQPVAEESLTSSMAKELDLDKFRRDLDRDLNLVRERIAGDLDEDDPPVADLVDLVVPPKNPVPKPEISTVVRISDSESKSDVSKPRTEDTGESRRPRALTNPAVKGFAFPSLSRLVSKKQEVEDEVVEDEAVEEEPEFEEEFVEDYDETDEYEDEYASEDDCDDADDDYEDEDDEDEDYEDDDPLSSSTHPQSLGTRSSVTPRLSSGISLRPPSTLDSPISRLPSETSSGIARAKPPTERPTKSLSEATERNLYFADLAEAYGLVDRDEDEDSGLKFAMPLIEGSEVGGEQLSEVSRLLKDAISAHPLPSFDEQFPTGFMPKDDEEPLEEMFDESHTRWSDEIRRPVDAELARQARIQLAVAKRLEGARRRLSAEKEDRT
ncbi:MAG: ATP-binding cassette domain-containing protein [Propionibacteriaceae bacterium]|nr:ATP-binding cassette domain-containing protein [Propionibacteriaceae bacterium]